MHTVKKDENMEQYTQTIGKNVYTVRGKTGYLVVRRELIISFFIVSFCFRLKNQSISDIIKLLTKIR